jgi:hypothetical protein
MADSIAYVSVEEVIHLHALAIRINFDQAREHIRDFGLLESSILRTQQ